MIDRTIALGGLVALLAACDDPAPADAGVDAGQCLAAPTELELGTGTDSSLRNYRALADGDAVSLIPGPQGGQHIWMALRGRGFDPSLPRVELRAYRPSDGALIGQLRIRLPMAPAPEDPSRLGLPSQTLVIDDRAYCTVLGGDVRVELDFNDYKGRCVTLRRTVRVADIDPSAPEAIREAWRRCCDARLPRCYAPDDGSVAADAVADAPSD
ncbi:MAG: hypothetical protein JWM10_120 [Myxococcaceae bacterium]|nr:hypothetical protein [Myxococcaceae bacterium]